MKKITPTYRLLSLKILLFVLWMFIGLVHGEENSNGKYRIPTMVISSGGGLMGSASFETNTTVGQQSPIPDPAEPPFSNSYDLYPGFWYTVANVGLTCPGEKMEIKMLMVWIWQNIYLILAV